MPGDNDDQGERGFTVIEQPAYTGFGFSDEEWGLLTGLPQSVLTAASAAESDSTRRTMAENAAGLETIAAGRESASALVAAVAAEIVSRVGDPENGGDDMDEEINQIAHAQMVTRGKASNSGPV